MVLLELEIRNVSFDYEIDFLFHIYIYFLHIRGFKILTFTILQIFSLPFSLYIHYTNVKLYQKCLKVFKRVLRQIMHNSKSTLLDYITGQQYANDLFNYFVHEGSRRKDLRSIWIQFKYIQYILFLSAENCLQNIAGDSLLGLE